MRLLLTLPIIAASMLTASSLAVHRYVRPCGNDAWGGLQNTCSAPFGAKRTIQAAIDDASDNDIIVVADGLYNGIGNRELDTQGKRITIRSANGPASCTIGGGYAYPLFIIDDTEDSNTVIDGFTIRRGQAVCGGGMQIDGTSPTVRNCIFYEHASDSCGGAVEIRDGTPTFEDCTFRNNDSLIFGGAVYAQDSSAVFLRCDFNENTAVEGAGAMNVTGGSIELHDCTLTSNSSSEHGGAITFANGVAATLAGVNTFEDNHADTEGGAIYVTTGATLHCTTVRFTDNDAMNGGAVHGNFASSSTFDNCSFESNTATIRAGAVRLLEAEGSFTGCLFAANESAIDGGAVQLQASSPTFDDCTFLSNAARRFGGALRIRTQSAPLLEDCLFTGNTANDPGGVYTTRGGAISTYDAADVSLLRCEFVLNTADEGGAAQNESSTLRLDDCWLQGNQSAVDGGGLHGRASDLHVLASRFGTNGTLGWGGGIYVADDSTLDIDDTRFEFNLAGTGGGIAISGSTVAAVNSDFESNSGGSHGGGIANFDGTLDVAGGTFTGNDANHGAGIANMVFGEATVEGVAFASNLALSRGGGLYNDVFSHAQVLRCSLIANSAYEGGGIANLSDLYVESTLLARNVAGTDGGGVYVDNGPIPSTSTLVNCTLAENQAGVTGGGIFTLFATADVINSILWENLDASGVTEDAQLYAAGPSLAVCDTSIQHLATYAGCGNVDEDPHFVNPTPGVDDYRLSGGSRCIDWGNPALPLSPLDLAGNPRLMDDPFVSDNPSYGSPVVDLGAYEQPAPSLTGDIDGDGIVGLTDLLMVLGAWGPCPGPGCPTDLDGDGVTDLNDLLIVLSNWS